MIFFKMEKAFSLFAALYIINQVASTDAIIIKTYNNVNFQGLLGVLSGAEGCQSLLPQSYIQAANSLETDTCIIIFKGANCTSYSYRLDRGDYPDLSLLKHDDTFNFAESQSYALCGRYPGYDEENSVLNVHFYGTAMVNGSNDPVFHGHIAEFHGFCSCTTLKAKSPYVAEITQIWNFGHCFKLYTGVNCTGSSVQLLGGRSRISENLSLANVGSFLVPNTSISPCEYAPECGGEGWTTPWMSEDF